MSRERAPATRRDSQTPGTTTPRAAERVALVITPSGKLVLEESPEEDGLERSLRKRMTEAFREGSGSGLLYLGAVEVSALLPPPFAWAREMGKLFMTRLCSVPDLEELRERAGIPPPPGEDLARLLAGMPPLRGTEYANETLLAALWRGMEDAFRGEISQFKGGVQEWLTSRNPAWNRVGRVCFHLALNKADPDRPFAFLATYTSRLSSEAKAQHLPLGEALKRYSDRDEKGVLLSLLRPVDGAAGKSGFLKELVDSGEIFHPVAWTPTEAYRFLRDIPLYEEAGVVVRVPEGWQARRPPRLQVAVTVGRKPPSTLGLEGLVDFSATLAVEGEPITEEEWREILRRSEPLALIRGKWVELDPDELRGVLKYWKAAQRAAEEEGVSFTQALRLLAGNGPLGETTAPPGTPEWSRVVAGDWLSTALDSLRSPETLPSADPGKDLKTELRPYQKEGVQWLRFASVLRLGACLADDMGLGKTVQVLALLLIRKRERPGGPHLLVVPASLIANWQAEIDRFAPSLRTLVAHPSACPPDRLSTLGAQVKEADLVITTYGSLLRLSWLEEIQWQAVILDEAQAIKNPQAKQTRAAKSLRSAYRIALTGTPVENRLGDLWSLFDFLNPGLLGSAREFDRLVKRLEGREGVNYAPLRRLIRPYILRRLKTDRRVIADLPDKTEVKAYCGLTKVQAVLYTRAVEELEGLIDAAPSDMARRGVVLAFLLRLKQICNHPSQWLRDGEFRPEASGKFVRLREIAQEIAAKQEKALIFTQFREMTAPLLAYLTGVFGRPGLVLDGETPVQERMARVNRFQEEDRIPFFVLSVRAGGTGLNLTAAAHVIHFDRWWNPAVENQATDRAYRIGQKKNVLVHKFLCRGTVEEKIDAMIEAKTGMSRELLGGGGEALLTEMGKEELLRTVSLDIHRALEYG